MRQRVNLIKYVFKHSSSPNLKLKVFKECQLIHICFNYFFLNLYDFPDQ